MAQSVMEDKLGAEPPANIAVELIYEGEPLFDDTQPRSNSMLMRGMDGTLSIRITSAIDRLMVYDDIYFQVAIQDAHTSTLRMYSTDAYNTVQVEDVLHQCNEGDRVIIILLDRKYTLARYTIDTMLGC